jgi:uncharacterized protein
MGTIGWLLLVAIGIALGFGAGRLWPGSSAKLTEMERQRDLAREDLKNYRTDVSQHFERTAELFDKVTSDYRSLYEHLALSARQLGAIPGESTEVRLAEPEQRRLAMSSGAAASAPGDSADREPAMDVIEDTPVRPPRDYDETPETEAEEAPGPEDDLAIRLRAGEHPLAPPPDSASDTADEQPSAETEPEDTQAGR